jgi:hypothetical protein
MFVVGEVNITEDLKREQAMYKDIYFLECGDGYFNLSDKVVHASSFFSNYILSDYNGIENCGWAL